MKHLSIDQLVGQVTPIRTLTRKERLSRWAELVRGCRSFLNLFHNLEYITPGQLTSFQVRGSHSAMDLAVHDPVFAAEGLNHNASVKDIMNFFEITQQQLHAFSCDCGGSIDNDRQAQRIASLE